MEDNFERLINFWGILTMIALVASAISLFFFRYYSAKQSSKQFENINIQISGEVTKAIAEISNTKDTINRKLNDEMESLLSEMKTNAKEANNSILDLKDQSSKLLSDLNSEISNFKNSTISALEEIKNPIGTTFTIQKLGFVIQKEKLPQITKKYIESGDLAIAKRSLKKYDIQAINSQMDDSYISPEIRTHFSESIKSMRMYIVNEIGQDLNQMEQPLKIFFPKPDKSGIDMQYAINGSNKEDTYKILYSSGNVESDRVTKAPTINSSNDICNKLVVIEIIKKNGRPESNYLDFKVNDFFMTDNLNNRYRFIPFKNISLLDTSIPIEKLKTKQYEFTMGILTCVK